MGTESKLAERGLGWQLQTCWGVVDVFTGGDGLSLVYTCSPCDHESDMTLFTKADFMPWEIWPAKLGMHAGLVCRQVRHERHGCRDFGLL